MSFFENKVFELSDEEKALLQTTIHFAEPLIAKHNRMGSDIQTMDLQLTAAYLELFLARLSLHSVPTTTFPVTWGSANYHNVMKILEENYNCALHLEDIAERSHLSVSQLKKVFRQYSDDSIMKSFTLIKLRHAIPMLDQGISITEISRELSFSSPSYFSRAFKREIGYSPAEYIHLHPNITI